MNPAPWRPEVPWDQDELGLHAMDLFDHAYWWEAHELWEHAWRCLEPANPLRDWAQGLIQVSAALLLAELGRDPRTSAKRGCERLARAEEALGPVVRGIALGPLRQDTWRALEGGPRPSLRG